MLTGQDLGIHEAPCCGTPIFAVFLAANIDVRLYVVI